MASSYWSSNAYPCISSPLYLGIQCIQITIALNEALSLIQSCFSQGSVLVNLNRSGIALIYTSLYTTFYFGLTQEHSIAVSVKRINMGSYGRPIQVVHKIF
jgi:hypothetical protein